MREDRRDQAPTRVPMRVPVDATATKFKVNRNWNRRHQDGKHKPKAKR